MNNNLHQMSDRSQYCPLFAVYDLHQNQRCHRLKSYFPESLVQTTLPFVGQASLQMENIDISLCVGFGGDACVVCQTKVTTG